MKVAFAGLGNMGGPMAANLVSAGHTLAVYNRSRERADLLARQGARVAASPREAAAGAEVLITMLADDAAVEAVALGPDGALDALPHGAIHVGMSTVSPELSRRLLAEHVRREQQYVAAPVFGRPEAAETAKLWIVAAGPAGAIGRCRPLFEKLGQGVEQVGDDPPAANVVKIGGNFLLAAAIGDERGVRADPEARHRTQTLHRGRERPPAALTGVRELRQAHHGRALGAPGFTLRHGLKHVRLALAAGDRVDTPLPLASLLRDRYLSAMARGWGDLDWAALARVSAVEAALESASASPAGP